MAGHNDRERISAVRPSHRTESARAADRARNLAVTAHFAIGSRQQRRPDRHLEGCSLDVKPKRERRAPAGEVLPQLLLRLAQKGMVRVVPEVGKMTVSARVVLPKHGGETPGAADQLQPADRRLHPPKPKIQRLLSNRRTSGQAREASEHATAGTSRSRTLATKPAIARSPHRHEFGGCSRMSFAQSRPAPPNGRPPTCGPSADGSSRRSIWICGAGGKRPPRCAGGRSRLRRAVDP